MFRLLELIERGVRLKVAGPCLEVTDQGGKTLSRMPFQELDAVVLGNPAVGLTGAVLAELGRLRIPLICCNSAFMPMACLQTTFPGASSLRDNILAQVAMPPRTMGRLWRHIIVAKIAGQAYNLRRYRQDHSLDAISPMVEEGDSGKVESRAARTYWRHLKLFPRRERGAEDDNRLLNYLYAIVYSAFVRSLCVVGLEPHLGIHHHNPGNPFCLASDLMEAFRPVADWCVLQFIQENGAEQPMNAQVREKLCRALYDCKVIISGEEMGIFHAIRRSVLSYKAVVRAPGKSMELPEYDGVVPGKVRMRRLKKKAEDAKAK